MRSRGSRSSGRRLAAAALLLAACGTPPGPAGPAAVAPEQPAARCEGLRGLRAERLQLTQAQWVEAGTQRARDPQTRQDVGSPLPAHCLLRGRLDERIGLDGEPYHIGFELRLPARGNGRLLHQGTDDDDTGPDGGLPMAVGRNSGATGWADNGLLRGFAAVAGNRGRPVPGPQFGLDPQAREDHAWRAHQRTAQTAQLLFERFYGRPPERRYFIGCGDGGRQGMMFTQRFPELFDGVVAQAPAMRASHGATIAAAWTAQNILRVAPRAADGHPVPALAYTPTQLARVAAEIVDRCDAADGLADGIVADTALCRIRTQRLVCPAGGEGCLTALQADALASIMAGPVNRDGVRLYFPFPWDPGLAAPGWRAWTLGQAEQGTPDARHLSRLSGLLGHVYATPPDPTLTLPEFDFDRDPLRLAATHRVHGTADEVLLRSFQQRGGRLMLIHGMADPVFSALETVDYQQRVNAAHGDAAASRFVRTFLVPGMTHCEGGPATDVFDALSAIVDWVEQGRAPDRLPARGSALLPGVERPLCPYPRITRYRGGDPARAESFECR